VIDAHHHLWTLHPGRHPWLGTQPFARSLQMAEYDATFAGHDIAATVWIEALATDPMAELAEAETVRRATQGRIGAALVAHVPLDAPDIEARLDRCAALSPAFRGVRDILSPRLARAPDLLERPGFLRGLHALAARGLVFDMMLTPPQMQAAADLLAQVPALTVALEHVGSPHDRSPDGIALWHAGIERLAALPNCVVKLSALHCLLAQPSDRALAGLVVPLTQAFTPLRMCVGSDWPVHDQTCPGPEAFCTLDRLTTAWTQADRTALFEGTARRVYRIA